MLRAAQNEGASENKNHRKIQTVVHFFEQRIWTKNKMYTTTQ